VLNFKEPLAEKEWLKTPARNQDCFSPGRGGEEPCWIIELAKLAAKADARGLIENSSLSKRGKSSGELSSVMIPSPITGNTLKEILPKDITE